MSNWVEEFFKLNPDASHEEEVPKSKEYKLDLFGAVLPSIDKRDLGYFSRLDLDQKKELEKNLWMITRYMSFSDSLPEHYICMINELGNLNVEVLRKSVSSDREGHPELQWKLLCLSSTKKRKFFGKLPIPKKDQKSKLEEVILLHYPLLRDSELELFLQINSREDIENFLKDNGYDDKTIKDILKTNKGK
jgi:hypothetical protein